MRVVKMDANLYYNISFSSSNGGREVKYKVRNIYSVDTENYGTVMSVRTGSIGHIPDIAKPAFLEIKSKNKLPIYTVWKARITSILLNGIVCEGLQIKDLEVYREYRGGRRLIIINE